MIDTETEKAKREYTAALMTFGVLLLLYSIGAWLWITYTLLSFIGEEL